jgi:acyl carrier protein
MTAPVQSRDAVWSPVLAGIRADALDCLQANLAVVADRALGPGAHLALGAPLDLRWTVADTGIPAVTADLDVRLAEAARLLGIRVTDRGDRLAGPAYVVADAYEMSWLPYAGREHLEHSFLAVPGRPGTVTVVDAYHNDTRWGSARPGVWRLPEAEVPTGTVLTLAVEPVPAPDPAAVLAANATRLAAADAPGYLAAVRAATGRPGAIEQLVLDVWLLSRSRLLHAYWLGEDAPQDWLTLGSHLYLAMRRGKPTPAPLVDELDRLLAAERTSPLGPLAVVEATLRDVLGVGPDVPVADRPLRELPNFDSFRLVEVVTRLEGRFGVELEADQLAPDNLRDAGSLAGLFGRVGAR